MSDWADEETSRLAEDWMQVNMPMSWSNTTRKAIASALRSAYERGKADCDRQGVIKGLREALGYGAMSKSYRALPDVLSAIRARADELEKQKP